MSGWPNSFQLAASDSSYCGASAGDQAGYSVAFVGDTDGDGRDEMVIGAPYNDDGGYNAGMVCLFQGAARESFSAGDLTDCDTGFLGQQSNVLAGGAVAAANDVNGDGLDDILIGNATEGGAWDGWTYVMFGTVSDWPQYVDLNNADASYIGETAGDDAGNAVAAAGDVNGDGFDDFLIGAQYSAQIGAVAGKVYLVLGKANGWGTNTSLSAADASFLSEGAGDVLGWSVSGAGDINSDGLADFLLGAPGNGEYDPDAGQAYLFLGNPGGWGADTAVASADASFIAEAANDGAAWALSGGGDLNGDGIDDFLIGAPYSDDGGADAGQVYVLFGNRCVDRDGDGFGDPGDSSCPGGMDLDCDDYAPDVHPGALESCNGIDDDCDGSIPADEADSDADGVRVCELDCDDTEATVYPGAVEECDGIDNDCDSAIPVWDTDQDGDGTSSCAGDCHDGDSSLHVEDLDGDGASPCDGDCDDTDAALYVDDLDGDGFSPCEDDCNDQDASVHPGAEENCDGLDGDCDGILPSDEEDEDEDGVMGCEGDCDDAEGDAFPGANEVCDGIDNDCDDEIDEVDEDGDGFSPEACGGEDCDDFDPEIHPMMPEVCDDNLDNDCDGHVDDADDECTSTGDDDLDDPAGDDDVDEEPMDRGCECSLGPARTRASLRGCWIFALLGWLATRR